MADVTDDRRESRFELATDDGVAFADYILDGPIITITHTVVPDGMQGRGIGARLVEGALALIRERGWRVRPLCPFVAAYMKEHPETRELLVDSADPT